MRLPCMLLAKDVTLPQVSEYLGIAPEIVTAYQKLFYDVPSFARGQIRMLVFPPIMLRPDCIHLVGWHLVGFHGGFEMLRELWEFGPSSAKARRFFRESGLAGLERAMAFGNYSRPTGPAMVAQVTNEALLAMKTEADAKPKDLPSVSDEHKIFLQGIMSSMKFFVTDPNTVLPAREPRLYERISPELQKDFLAICGQANNS